MSSGAAPVAVEDSQRRGQQQQQQQQEDLHLNDYASFDPQPLIDSINKHREKTVHSFTAIVHNLDELNNEIQAILGDYLMMRYTQVEELMRSGQADIARMERDQAEMQGTMVTFLDAIKNAFSIFVDYFRKDRAGGGKSNQTQDPKD
ncbi:hypothetical protein BGZ83_009732 [Gryganskiella cystojenkinii]|nr:hypothetical protein BGZ83_009732 [Gryganskiella cystojenkinii]